MLRGTSHLWHTHCVFALINRTTQTKQGGRTMRKTKRTISTIAVITALVLTSGLAFAHGMWGKRGYGSPGSAYGDYVDLSPEQREKIQAQEKKFYEETIELRRELYQKRLELQGLWADPKSDAEKIKAKQREVSAIQQKLEEKALEYGLAMREIAPEGYFCGGPGGHGPGMGHGFMHGGGGHMWGPGSGHMRGYGGGY